METSDSQDFVTLTSAQLTDPYQAGFDHGRDTKLKEVIIFQSREHALFISSQLSFFTSFLATLDTILPLFNLN